MNSSQHTFKDLDRLLNEIPEKTIFRGSNKARFKMLTLSIIGLLLTIMAYAGYLKGSASLKLVIFFAVICLFFSILTKVKWNDGNVSIIEFSHQNIRIKDINQVIPLEAISEYDYRYDDQDTLTLIIEKPIQGLKLTSKVKGSIGASVLITQNTPRQIIKIIVPYSFTLDGKRLSPEECVNILEAYLSIPEIKRQMILAT